MNQKLYQFHEISDGTKFWAWHNELKMYEKLDDKTGKNINGEIKTFEKIDLVLVREQDNQ